MAQVVVELSGDEAKLLRSMQKIIDQNSKVKDSFKDLGKDAKSVNESIEKSSGGAVAGLASIVAGYVSVQSIIGGVSAAIKDQIELQKESLQISNSIAGAQAGAIKNLTGLSPQDKALALSESKKLQAEIGFRDQKYIVDAVGAGYSASGDIKLTMDAVRAAAELTRNSPEDLSKVASGAIDISRGTGITDAKKNLGFGLQVGAISRVEDPAALMRTLAPTVNSGVNGLPNQNKQEAAKEIASEFSALNKYATDTKGLSTQTAETQFNAKMDQFFRTLPEEREKIDAAVKEMEAKQSFAAHPFNKSRLDRADLNIVQKRQIANRVDPNDTSLGAQDARLDLDEAIAHRDQLLREFKIDDSDVIKLRTLKKQQAAMKDVVDPGTKFGRNKLFQKSPDLRDKFLENPFGEIAFQGGFRDLLTEGTPISKEVEFNKTQLSFDPKTYFQTVAETETLSPELVSAKFDAQEEGRKQLERDDPSRVRIGLINKITENALRENRRAGLQGAFDYATEGIQTYTGGASSTPKQAAQNAIANLDVRKQFLFDNVMHGDKSAVEKTQKIDLAIEQISKVAQSFSNPPTTEGRTKELMSREKSNKENDQERTDWVSDLFPAIDQMAKAASETTAAIKEQNALVASQNEILSATKDAVSQPKHTPSPIQIREMAKGQ